MIEAKHNLTVIDMYGNKVVVYDEKTRLNRVFINESKYKFTTGNKYNCLLHNYKIVKVI